MTTISEWPSCLADQFLGIAFFNGIRIDTDRITDPRWDRVLPVLVEEQVLMCRIMAERKLLGPGVSVLDVGTGSGVFAIWAAAHGCNVVAIDSSPRAIKFANYNLSHPDNIARIAAAGGSVQVEGANFLTWASTKTHKFDLVILAPPYNPTAPGVFPARHAEAGPLGQDRFHEQLPLAYQLIGSGGKVVGNQMAFHGVNKVDQWWRQRIDSIGPSAARECHVSFAPILSLAEYPAKEFLQEQYRYFLDPSLNPDTHQRFRDYIQNSLRPLQEEAVFGLYYYEVEKAPNRPHSEFEPKLFNLPFDVPATWQDRVDLHRRIVEHTSQKNSIPTAALFLHNDFTPPLPDAPVAFSETTPDLEPAQLFQGSVLRTLLTWILQNRIVGSDSSAFDLLLIDIGPWFYSEKGRGAIRNEALLCGGPEFAATVKETLSGYQRNTKAQQLCRLAPFLHPSFTGASDPSEWGGVNFHAVDDASFDFGLDDDDKLRLSRWTEQIARTFDGLDALGEQAHSDVIVIGSIPTAYATSSLSELGVASPREYLLRLEDDYGAAIPPATKDRDLELVHMTFHKRLREIVRPRRGDGFSSALLGMPLSMAFSGRDSEESDLPDNYRGGLWIYAASKNKIGPKQEFLLFDLMRLASITAGASISARATRSLIEVERLRANIFELQPRAAWSQLVDASQPLFPVGNFHTAKNWHKKYTANKLQSSKRLELISICERFLTDVKIESNWLTFEASLCLARAASRRSTLAVPFIESMLRHKWALTFPFPAIKSRKIESCPARVVVALRYFLEEIPGDVESTSWMLSIDKVVRYTLTAVYKTPEAAQDAAVILAISPKARMQRENRDTPGEACMYADWLRQEARNFGRPVLMKNILTAWWEFELEWIE